MVSLVTRLIYLRNVPGLRRISKELLAVYGVEVPREVNVGPGLRVLHRGFGTVVHGATDIGRDVTIYHGVTIGRADVWDATEGFDRIVIGDGVILCAGAVVLCSEGTLTVGARTVVAANSVLTKSTGEGEIWAGVPARKLRDLDKKSDLVGRAGLEPKTDG